MIQSDSNSKNIGYLIKHGYVWAVFPKNNGTVALGSTEVSVVSFREHPLWEKRLIPHYSYNEWTYVLSYRAFITYIELVCGLVVRVPGYRSRGPGFDSRSYQIF
jgi:hypothetical protein